MPLETFRGASFEALLARAQQELGPDAVVVQSRSVVGPNGQSGYVVVAGDPRSVAASRDTITGPARGGASRTAFAPSGVRGRKGGPLTIALVGPTGAGKTTTLAKLAAHPKVFGARQVAMLCLDTYRVGAVDQLKGYAELLQLPFAVVHEPAEALKVRDQLAPHDVLLIDCPGRGPRNGRDSEQALQALRRLAPDEVHLVLPAGLQPRVARDMADRTAAAGVTHLLASKMDEMPDDWTVFRLAAERGLPMRWVADGQEVPGHLRAAEARLLTAVAEQAAHASEQRGVA
jgi:flagellar biosynthesis protein FlhF